MIVNYNRLVVKHTEHKLSRQHSLLHEIKLNATHRYCVYGDRVIHCVYNTHTHTDRPVEGELPAELDPPPIVIGVVVPVGGGLYTCTGYGDGCVG